MVRLLRRRELPRVELAFQIFNTGVVDAVDAAADSILINQSGLSKFEKAPIHVLATEVKTLIAKNANRRLWPLYIQIFKNSIVRDNHPRCGKSQRHNASLSGELIICLDECSKSTSNHNPDTLRIELSTSNIDLRTGTGAAGAVARRSEKRTGEIGPLPCDGSGATDAETMNTRNPPGKSSTEWGTDR